MMPHRKTVRHFHEPGQLHELTFSCSQRLPLLTNDDWRERLAQCINAANQDAGVELVAFVFMPEHVHLLIRPTASNPSLGRYLARIKQPFSKQIGEALKDHSSSLLHALTVRERPGKSCFRFWQEGPGFDRNLFSPKTISSSIDYIHSNPVKRGLCQRAIDWKWSSARFYLTEPPSQYTGLPFVHGLPAGMMT